jgi:hypothetical protein
VQDIDNEELKLFRSKIGINRSRGNTVAVQRDEYAADFIMTKRAIGEYVVYLVHIIIFCNFLINFSYVFKRSRDCHILVFAICSQLKRYEQ